MKREAENQITKEGGEEVDGGNADEGFKKANPVAMKGRVFAAPRTRKSAPSVSAPDAPKSPFSGFTFAKPIGSDSTPQFPSFAITSGPNVTAQFTAPENVFPNMNAKENPQRPTFPSFFNTSLKESQLGNVEPSKDSMTVDKKDNSRLLDFGRNLKGLNASFVQHLQKETSSDSFVDFGASFESYSNQRAKILSDFSDVKDDLLKTQTNKSEKPNAVTSFPPKPTSIFPSFPPAQPFSSTTSQFSFAPKPTATFPDMQTNPLFAPPVTEKMPDPAAEDAGEDDEDGEKDEQVNPDVFMKGSGEESEDTVFEVRAKAFRFSSEKKEWSDVGLGMARINVDRVSGKKRFIMRAEASGRVLLNFFLIKGMSPTREGKSAMNFVCVQDGKPVKYLLRVKEPGAADELVTHIGSI
ncbi:hypothetical protein HDU67_001903 [Dinochytrium kinnereticum]|nr:hypothetical protein HDU67_001903 [Dinochytrium kinnereticum]